MTRNTLWIAVGLVTSAVGCSSSSNLSVSAGTNRALTATAPAGSALDLGNGIQLDRVRVVVRKLKLEGQLATTTTTLTSNAGADGKTEVENERDDASEPVLGPFLIDLSGTALSSGLVEALEALVPQGTFHEVKLAIGPVSATQAGSDAKLGEMAAKGASLILDGQYKGSPFIFVSAMTLQIEKEGDFVVGSNATTNVTLTVDPATWFAGSGSIVLDPGNAANGSAIESNIRRSLAVFKDDDHDGHVDD